MKIVDFDPSQYESLAAVLQAALEGNTFDATALSHRDVAIADVLNSRRIAAVCNGEAVAFAEFTQVPEGNRNGIYFVNIVVHPGYQGKGIGSKLYECIFDQLREYDPQLLRVLCRADNNRSIRFLADRGFVLRTSILELHLAVDTYRTRTLADSSVIQLDFDFVSMDSLQPLTETNVKMYDLVTELRKDVPILSSQTGESKTRFAQSFLAVPTRIHTGTFIALHRGTGEFAGISDLHNNSEHGLLAGLTGVRREYRKQGIATTLKGRTIHFALTHGYNRITTFNEASNRSILALNRHLGFVDAFTWQHCEKQLSGQ